MSLNTSKGNMYDFVTHTWNAVKGECFHDCSYCYMKRWGKLKPVRFDEKELKTDLGKNNFIFVGSSCDMFAENISDEWILKTLDYCNKFDNKYLFQSKNPERFNDYKSHPIMGKSIFCTTIESNIYYGDIMRSSPMPSDRAKFTGIISKTVDTYVTIEPILKFDLDYMVKLIKTCNAKQVNIGADSGGNNLLEPNANDITFLTSDIGKFTKVKLKKNIKRLLVNMGDEEI